MGSGKRKLGIRDVSKEKPTKEDGEKLRKAFASVSTEPLMVAILGAAMIEHDLEELLRPRFPRKDQSTWDRLTSDGGPLGTLANKINTGYAFSIYDETTRCALLTISHVRNAFAHSKKLISFDHELIRNELRSLTMPEQKRSKFYKDLATVQKMAKQPGLGPQAAYICLCLFVSTRLVKKDNSLAKRRNSKPWSKRMAAALRKYQPGSSGGLLGGLYGVDPTTPIPLPEGVNLLDSLPKLSSKLDNKG